MKEYCVYEFTRSVVTNNYLHFDKWEKTRVRTYTSGKEMREAYADLCEKTSRKYKKHDNEKKVSSPNGEELRETKYYNSRRKSVTIRWWIRILPTIEETKPENITKKQ